jgi:type II secretory pathway pseudopilin PulG
MEPGDGQKYVVVAIVAFVAGVLLGSLAAWYDTQKYYRKEAICNGAAHWKVDPQTGDTEFKWGKSQP